MADEVGSVDHGRKVDWSKSAVDYSIYRPGPPPSFYQRLATLGVGLPGQRILDLGTGTGVLARRFATQGCSVAGVDISEGQLAMARKAAAEEGSGIDFRIAPAEATTFPAGSFDVLTANQCWLYFDKPKVIAEARRLLAPGGLVMTSHFSWLPRLDPVARRTEELVLKHNPAWSAGDWSGHVTPMPKWADADFRLRAMFYYDEPIPFTRETWRGRWRACRGVGASMSPEEVAKFDVEHDRLLRDTLPEAFTILHRIDAHVFAFK